MVHITRQTLQGRGLVRKLAVAAGALLLAWGGAWLALPGVIASQIQDKASQALGRAVTVRSVELAPWSMAVTVRGLEVAGLSGQPPALSVERLFVNASLTSLLRWAPVLDALELDQPVVRISQTAPGVWDFADVLRKLQEDAEPDDPQAGPARMALYNIQLRDGRVEFNDQVAGVQHTLDALQLQLPFISTLPSQREVKVQPHLSLRWNGGEVTTQAEATPFDSTRSTRARLLIKQLDIAPYAAYLPADLPVRLQQGVLDAEVVVAFEQHDQPELQLQGSALQLSQLQLQDREGQALAGWSQLKVELGDTRPLQQQVRVAAVVVQQPYGHLHRRADGALWPAAASSAAPVAAPAAANTSKSVAADAGWSIAIDRFDVENGSASWRDDAQRVGAALRLDQLQLQAQDVTWPMQRDAQWTLSAQLQTQDRTARGTFSSSGKGTMDSGQASVQVDKLDAQLAQAYVRQWLKLPVGGLASLQADVNWQQGRVQASVPALSIEAVARGVKAAPDVAWSALQVRNLQLDSAQQQVQVEQVALQAPRARVQRSAQGRWMYEEWLQPAATATVPAHGKHTGAPAAGKPWQVLVKNVELSAGQVEFRDASLGEMPLDVRLSDVQLRMQNVDSIKGTAHAKLSARLAERTRRGAWGQPGSLAYEGDVQLDPLLTKGRVRIHALPLQAFEPYMAPYLNVRLLRALASLDADVQYAQRAKGPQLQMRGQAAVADVHVQTVLGDVKAAHAVQGPHAAAALEVEDLLRWKQLRLQGVQVDMQPAQRPHIQVRGTDLQDFYARIVVLPQGRLNLQNLVKAAEPVSEPVAAPATVAQQGEAAAAMVPAPVPTAEPAARIDMGPIALRGGVIKFSDYFIQPNYSADLTALNGSLEAFSSQPLAAGEAPALAKLLIEGVAQGTAQLHIDGAINPLAQPLALDVRAQMTGLDLSPLTPYSIKYVGHGIEKGKLSMDVRYRVQPDGLLTASNQLVLNQLTFGDPVDGAPASLPVRLAVALLADSDGVIDLNLPISGSLNDPQFRLAPIIFKIIGNIIRKAVTAPFSLLTGAFASEDEKSDIRFEAGRSTLDAQAQSQLQQLAKAMQSKPRLKLTLVGQADRDTEASGWKRAKLEQLVNGGAGEQDDGPAVTRTDKQKLAALKQIYRATVKDRERNLLGLTKDVPEAQMRALIERDMLIPATAWQELAAARAQNVRDYLLAQGVDPQRVFLGSASEKAGAPAAPAVLLNISVQ